MPKKQAFIDKSGVKFVENFQKNQKIKKFPSGTEIRYLTAFMQKSQGVSASYSYTLSRFILDALPSLNHAKFKAQSHSLQQQWAPA